MNVWIKFTQLSCTLHVQYAHTSFNLYDEILTADNSGENDLKMDDARAVSRSEEERTVSKACFKHCPTKGAPRHHEATVCHRAECLQPFRQQRPANFDCDDVTPNGSFKQW